MSKRFIPIISKEVALVCRNPQKKYFLCANNQSIFELPHVSVEGNDEKSIFQKTILAFCQKMNLQVNLKGVVQVKLSHESHHQHFKCIYYGETKMIANPDRKNIFSSFPNNDIQMNQEVIEILSQLQRDKIIYNLELFRQNFKEEAPRQVPFQSIFKID